MGDYTAISTALKESYEWRPIDVLINNAGITRSGFMENFSLEDINTVVQTNVLGSIYPVHAILPQLKLRSRDHPILIVFIGSLASLVSRRGCIDIAETVGEWTEPPAYMYDRYVGAHLFVFEEANEAHQISNT